ncbi:multidrug transporter [Faecalitalea cylindroides]|uniref:multidrug transporter n=1 Tax=Faecalitalea cylindroides TaxID=39483 RepID=UPI00232C8AF0|nr:multidrug transporter [Faecalitalea cylindroides]MDB7951587.1 multidrug transporter [Faecalitalea cylindroides]MDB7958432.1 multidrug transporter [Faecalitalea cylindroides]MDB7960388.1 multidrug transporter [Faecalitalea cylindroides]MDB7962258.1 multidrug transporter [Faecalitalea cylindroides]MDB7964129.1 multidrug transporter [Faecalitalea cylindroides]
MYEVKESDWKIFRKRVPRWQEDYMKKLNKEYIEILSRDGSAAQNFWDLENRVFKDKRSVGVVIDMRRSKMLINILDLLEDHVINLEDLDEFSEELRKEVTQITKR